MLHYLIIYPTAHHKTEALLKEVLEKDLHGKITNRYEINLNGEQALGFIAQFYWEPKSLDLRSLRTKVEKSGWKNALEVKPLIILEWESPNTKLSNQLMGTGAPLKCYLRSIAYQGRKTIDFKDFRASNVECRLWKGTLHSPDRVDDKDRLEKMLKHESTIEWMKQVPWGSVIPYLVGSDFNLPKDGIWDAKGRAIAKKDKEHKNGVYWRGLWMAIPPITEGQWKNWIGVKQNGGFLWSHPATFSKEDLSRDKNDYVFSWKADGVHGIITFTENEWLLKDEKGDIREKGQLDPAYRHWKGLELEGEWLPDKKEFIAFDIPNASGFYDERIKRAEIEWKGKKQNEVLWELLPVGETISIGWKPSYEPRDVSNYLEKVEKSGYGTDGLIFTPKRVEWKDLGNGKANMILKWKPMEDQTVDVYLYKGKIWLKGKNRVAPEEFECVESGIQKNYPREWRTSRLSTSKPQIEWKDGSTMEDHNGEIWEIRWKRTVEPNAEDYLWEAVRRRESNKETLLRNAGNQKAICQGRFIGPNAWRTMESVEENLKNPILLKDLEKFCA